MSADASPGILASIRGTLSTLLAILHTRVQLLGLDLEEQFRRLVQTLVLAVIAVSLFIVGLVCASLLVVLSLWESHRMWAVALVLGFLFGGAALAAWLCARRVASHPPPFEATLQELDRDMSALRGDS